MDIADEIGVSQTMVSRSTQPLRDIGLVEETAGGLTLAENEISKRLSQFIIALDFQS